MYELLKQVYSVTSKKSVTSVLKQIRIDKGQVIGTNGRVTIGATIPELSFLDVTVPADKFVKAIDIVDLNQVKMKVTATKKLSIISDKFRVLIPTTPNEAFPMVKPVGDFISCDGLIEALTNLLPFIGDDAVRPWSNGVLLTNDYTYATNNVSIARYKVDMELPDTILPTAAIVELLRIGKDPIGIVHGNTSISFIMDNDTWLHSALIDASWPDVTKFFTGMEQLPELNHEVLIAVQSVYPFCPEPKFPAIYFNEEGISTGEGTMNSQYKMTGLPTACFHGDILLKLLPSVTNLDLTPYPAPCPFTGSGGLLQGVVMGLIM